MEKRAKRVDNKGRKLPDGFSQRADGRYQVRFTVNGKRFTVYDMNLTSLKAKFIEKQNDLNKCIFNNLDGIILNDWFEYWLCNYKSDKIKKVTYKNYENYWKWYVAETLGKLKIRDIKRVQIIALYNSLMSGEKHISIGTLRYVNNLIFSVFEQAEFNDIINRNPASKILKEIVKPEQKQKIALTVDEQNIFFEYIGGNKVYNKYESMLIVAFGTGVRVGELTALTWDDIDFENETISVNKTLHYVRYMTQSGHHYVITSPKTLASIRKIPMSKEVKEAFENQKNYQKSMDLKGNMDIDGYHDFVFTTLQKTPYTPDGVNAELGRIINSYNVEETEKVITESREPVILRKFSAHFMRRTFATRCFENGMDIKVVQGILGHARIETTYNIYITCNTEKAKKEMNEKMYDFIKKKKL